MSQPSSARAQPPIRSAARSIEVARTYTFDASHQLTWHPGKCSRLHGHTYHMHVVVIGQRGHTGVVLDFDDLDVLVRGLVLDRFDHTHLNDFVSNPTVENILVEVWDALEGGLRTTAGARHDPLGPDAEAHRDSAAQSLALSEVTLWETPRSWARMRA